MREFSFYVDMPTRVTIYQSSGVPGEHYNINIDGCHYGTVVKRDGKWQSHLNPGAQKILSRDDVQAICEWIDEVYPD